MDSSEGEDREEELTEQVEPKKRGRPLGKADQKPRYRRTAEHISADKLAVAQMKLDALRESEEKKLATKKTRTKKPSVSETTLQPAAKPAKREAPREETPPPELVGTRRQALYDSGFPSSPLTRYGGRRSHY